MSIGWRSKGKLILTFHSQDLNCDLKKNSQCVTWCCEWHLLNIWRIGLIINDLEPADIENNAWHVIISLRTELLHNFYGLLKSNNSRKKVRVLLQEHMKFIHLNIYILQVRHFDAIHICKWG